MKITTLSKNILFSISLLLLSVNLSVAQRGANKNMVWKISSKNGTEAYLAGSLYVMKPDLYPLDQVYQKVFDKSDILCLETNLDSLKSKQKFSKLKYYPKGDSLRAHISSETYEEIRQHFQNLDMPMSGVNKMKPWLIAYTYPIYKLQKTGYLKTPTINRHFFKMAKKADKKVLGLEKPEDQLTILADLPLKQQIKYLKFIFNYTRRFIKNFDEIMQCWKNGNIEKLYARDQMDVKKISKTIYQKMWVKRNKNLASEIEHLLKTAKMPMIILGVGNLAGPKNVMALLKKDGYAFEQL